MGREGSSTDPQPPAAGPPQHARSAHGTGTGENPPQNEATPGVATQDLPVHDLLAAVAQLRIDTDRVVESAARAWSLSQTELYEAVAATAAARSSLERAWLCVVKSLDDSSGLPDRPRVAGSEAPQACAPNARTFLVEALRFAPAQAALDVAAAHALDADTGDLPAVGAALHEGAITRAHVDAAVRVARDLPRRLATSIDPSTGRTGMAAADSFLAEHARAQSPATVGWLGQQLLSQLAPDRADRYDPDAVLRRRASRSWDATGMLRGRFQMDGAAGAAFAAVWDTLSTPQPAGTATDDAGQQVLVRDDRSHGVRLVDALCAMSRLAGAALGITPETPPSPAGQPPPEGPASPAHVLITASVEQVDAAERGSAAGSGLAQLHSARRGPISSWLLGRLSCGATLQRVLLAGNGAVLDVGRRVRLATPSQRRALVVRDGGCVIPGCSAPPVSCDIHHVVPWSRGGATDLSNLAMVCARHHTAVHAGHWTLVTEAGVPWAVPPPWVDPQRRRLRNTTHQTAQAAHGLGGQLRLLLDDDRSGGGPAP